MPAMRVYVPDNDPSPEQGFPEIAIFQLTRAGLKTTVGMVSTLPYLGPCPEGASCGAGGGHPGPTSPPPPPHVTWENSV